MVGWGIMKKLKFLFGLALAMVFYQNCGNFKSANSNAQNSASDELYSVPLVLEKRIIPLDSDQYLNVLKKQLTNSTDITTLSLMNRPFNRPNPSRFSTDKKLVTITDSDIEKAWLMAEFVAEKVASSVFAQKTNCLSLGETSQACLNSVVTQLGKKLFNYNLTSAEMSEYSKVLTDGNIHISSPQEAFTGLLVSMLMSPRLIYRSEIGNESGQLNNFEIANFIAYTLTDNPPDSELMAAADSGLLVQQSEREKHVRRLLIGIDTNSKVLKFFREYFVYTTMDSSKDLADFPKFDFTAAVKDTDHLVQYLLKNHASKDFWKQVMSTNKISISSKSAPFYGLSTASTVQTVVDSPDQRVGILTQPSWLVHFTKDAENYAIGRGRYIREDILCGQIPKREIDSIPALPEDEMMTLREKMEVTASGTCNECHAYMNPLGLAYQFYDHFGRYRVIEAGRPVDSSGALDGTGDQDGGFKDHQDMMRKLASSKTTEACFLAHSFQYWLGGTRRPGVGAEQLQKYIETYTNTGGNFTEVIIKMMSSPEAIQRVSAGEG
jgi:hypothetical protein